MEEEEWREAMTSKMSKENIQTGCQYGKKVQMDFCRILVFAVIILINCGVPKALFTIQTVKSHYIVQFGGNVSLECHFQVPSGMQTRNLKVYWEHISEEQVSREVINFSEGKESPLSLDYRGRVKLIKEELDHGRAILHISNVKISDAGRYLCIISSVGADYKYIALEVQASYKKIYTSVTNVITDSGNRTKVIGCQSEGYPLAEVTWLHDRLDLSTVANTTFTQTAEKTFVVTSMVKITSEVNKTFTCQFWNKAFGEVTSETFTIPDVSAVKRNHFLMIFSGITLSITLVFVLVACKQAKCKRLSKIHIIKSTKQSVTQHEVCSVKIQTSLSDISSVYDTETKLLSTKTAQHHILVGLSNVNNKTILTF